MGQSASLSHPGQHPEQTNSNEGASSSQHQVTANGLASNHLAQPGKVNPPANNTSTVGSNNLQPNGGQNTSKVQTKKKKVVGVKKVSKTAQHLGRKLSSTGKNDDKLARKGDGARSGFRASVSSTGKADVNHHTTTYDHISEVHKSEASHEDSSDIHLPSTELRRQRRLSATTSSSTGTNGQSLPVITVTDYSEAESTDIDFDPLSFNDRPGDENRTSTPKARPEDMDISVSKYQSVSENFQKEYPQANESSGAERRVSKTSKTSIESASKANSRSASKRNSSEIQIKKGLLGRNDPKIDAVNKWKNIVSEFEEVYVDGPTESETKDLKKKEEKRKVSKLTNLDQYENVRQVFNRSMPLPMQMAPPGARVEDIEAETASETSSYSWNLMTPMGKTSRHGSASQEMLNSGRTQLDLQAHSDSRQSIGASSQENVNKGLDANRSHHGSLGVLNSREARNSRQLTRSEMAGSRSRSASRSGSRSHSAMGLRSQSHERIASKGVKHNQSKSGDKQGNVKEESYVQESKQIVQSKRGRGDAGRGKAKMVNYRSRGHKGVKFRKVTDLNEQAAIIVDDVLNGALRLLYGDRRQSSNSSSKMSSGHASSSHQSSNHSSKKSSHVQQHVEHVVEKHFDHRKINKAKERRDIRSGSMRPIPLSGQYSTEKSSYHTRSLPPPSQKRSSNSGADMTGMYDMVIQHLGEEKKQTSEAELEWNRRLKEGTQRPRSDDSNSTTSIKITHNEVYPTFHENLSKSEVHSKHPNPPTITKGTVTRVFHDLDHEGQVPSSLLLAQLQSMQQQPQSSDYSIDYSTNTWPLNRAYPNPPIDTTGTTSAPLSPSSSHYNTLPTGLNTSAEMNSDQWAYYSDGAYPSGQHSFLIGDLPGGYIDDRYYLSPPRSPPQGGNYTLTSVTSAGKPYHDQNRVDLMIDTNHLMRSLPLRLPSYQPNINVYDSYRQDDISQSINLPAIEEREEHSGTYSNEPIIVADLMEKNDQPASGSFYSTDNSRVNMNKNQQLNFYVFNQGGQQPGVPKITYAAQDVQARFGSETQQMTNFFLEEGQMKEMVSQAVQAYRPEEPTLPDHREYTLYHKQTQTRPTPEPKPKKPKTIERKKEKIIKRFIPRREKSPERSPSPVVHRETHHYITKEREIQKLPPAAPDKAEYSVQTDMTGNEWEDEMDSLYKALNDAERRAYEAERAMDEMQSSNAAMETVVREMHQVVEEQEKKPKQEIPVLKQEPDHESESESEEEFYEWTEIEEKEQRLSMAIFEEIEFNLQRTQGGNSSTESGKKSELVPWIIPDKYEAIVDRRKQKVTQIKDIDREGDQVFYQSGQVPPGSGKGRSNLTLEFDTGKDDVDDGGVTEQRDMTLKRESNIHHHAPNHDLEFDVQYNSDPSDNYVTERHYTTKNVPKTPNGKRNYMSTFEHEMDRAKNAPVRAKGRTNYRSDTHIPVALKRMESAIEGDSEDPRIKTSLSFENSPRKSGPGGRYKTALHKESVKKGNNNPQKGKHSVNLIRGVLGMSLGDPENEEHSERHSTSVNRRYGPKSEGGSHSTTHITQMSSKPERLPSKSKHHVTKFSTNVNGTNVGNKHKSSAELHIEKLRGFEIPIERTRQDTHYYTGTELELANPENQELSDNNSEKSSRFISRFDPGNIFFTARSRSGSSETLLEMAKEPVVGHPSHYADEHDNDSLPDTLPIVEAEHMKRKSVVTRSENQQLPPKVTSRVEEDDEGNLVRVTTTEQQMTKTVNYLSEPEEKKKVPPSKTSDEALVEESFVEVDLTTENIREALDSGPEDSEEGKQESKNIFFSIGDDEPDVVSETSVAYKAIEYDDQEKSLGIGNEEHNFPEDKFLYDMKTATLQPVRIKDQKSGETLMQYSLGDTMVTEL